MAAAGDASTCTLLVRRMATYDTDAINWADAGGLTPLHWALTQQRYDAAALPLIPNEDLRLDDDGSLPGFSIPASHRLHGHADERLSFPTHTKFFMLRHFSNTYFGGMGGATVHGERDINELTSRLRLFTQSLSMMHPNTTLASLAQQTYMVFQLISLPLHCPARPFTPLLALRAVRTFSTCYSSRRLRPGTAPSLPCIRKS